MIQFAHITLPGNRHRQIPISELNDYKRSLTGEWERIYDCGCRFVLESVAVDTIYLKAEPF